MRVTIKTYDGRGRESGLIYSVYLLGPRVQGICGKDMKSFRNIKKKYICWTSQNFDMNHLDLHTDKVELGLVLETFT